MANAFAYDDVENLLESLTEVQVGYPGQSCVSFLGTGFTFNKFGDLTGGTITSFRASGGLLPGCSCCRCPTACARCAPTPTGGSGDDTIQLKDSVFTKLESTGPLASKHFVANAGGNAKNGNDFLVYQSKNRQAVRRR